MKKSFTPMKLFASMALTIFLVAKAQAQIVYTDVVPDLTSTSSYNLDLDNDGTVDFVIKAYVNTVAKTPCGSGNTQHIISVFAPPNNGILGKSGTYALNLAAGSTIGSSSAGWVVYTTLRMAASGRQCMLRYNGKGYTPYWGVVNPGLWYNVTDGYLGLEFTKGGNTYYGWARLSTSNALSFTIKDYAYNATPNQSIPAGSMSLARMADPGEASDPYQLKVAPNPVSATAAITFFLSESEQILVTIVDARGQLVREISEVYPKGESRVEWMTNDLPAGVYFLRFQSAEFSRTEKIVVTK